MDFGNVIERSWELIWRHRFLWLLGILGGGGMGTCGLSVPTANYNVGAQLSSMGFRQAEPIEALLGWINQNPGTILLIIGILFAVGVALWIISLIFEGALVSATLDLAMGRSSRFAKAGRIGLRYFWRFFGLFWLLTLIQIGLLVVVAVPAALIFTAAGQGAGIWFGLLWVVISGIIWIAIQVVLGVVVPYAFRAIVIDNLGPIRSMRFGWGLLRRNLGTSLLALVLSIVLGLGWSIAITVVFFIVLLLLAIPGFLIYRGGGLSVGFLGFAGIGGLIVWIVVLVLGGIYNAYFYSYWTFIYLKLTGRLGRSLELIPPDRPPYTDGGAPPTVHFKYRRRAI